VYQTAGRWVATLPIDGQRPKKFYGQSQDQAIARRKQFTDDIAAGRRDASGQQGRIGNKKITTVIDWVDHWLNYIVKPVYDPKTGRLLLGRQPTTFENYRWHVERHIRPTRLARIKLVELQTSDVEVWHKQLLAKPIAAAATSAYEARRTLVIALNAALDRRQETRVTYNPASAFHLDPPYRRKKPAPDPEALVRVLDEIRGHRLELAVHLGLRLGLRRQEICGLQMRDFDFKTGELLIRRRVNRVRGLGVLARGGVKMKSEDDSQTVQLHDAAYWRALLAVHRQRALDFYMNNRTTWTGLDPRDEQAFLFTNRKGQPMDPKLLYKWVKTIFARAGCPTKTLHELRHDFAGMLADSGVSLLEISRAMRHASTAVTDQVYTHLTDDRSRTAVGKASEWLDRARDIADEETG
jgi:integrase